MNFERIYFSQMLEKFHGNISKAAREAKVSRKTIYNIMKKHILSGHQIVEKPVWQREEKRIFNADVRDPILIETQVEN